MDKIQQLILDTYAARPRHFTQILKRNKEVLEYVNQHASHITDFLEQLYFAVYRQSNICPNGNIKPLKTFAGYSFCGKTGVCQCARISVSNSVATSKNAYTSQQRAEINQRRETTTLAKYGVKNNAQTELAKKAHNQFYQDTNNVDQVVARVKRTKLDLHGDENYNNRSKAEETCLNRYGVKNTWSLTSDKQNPNLEILKNKEQLSLYYPKYSVEEIGKLLDVHPHTVYRYLSTNGFREPYKSTFEKEIIYFLNELGITNIVANKRTIIGKELDIFLPDSNLAIEYNGVYWHHDKIPHITKTYHRDKFRGCENQGIELFTIFSDSWDDKKEIWKNKIKAKLGLADKVYARNTLVVNLEPADTIDILNNNHIQGYCTSEVALGLECNGKLVAAMTFSKSRAGIGKNRGDHSYELVRYVSSKTVVGGASKLLSYFIKLYQPKTVVSYSDNQYSTGNLYRQLGFRLENNESIGYKYYDPQKKKMYHRYNFTKHKLVKQGFDADKTEKQIMDELGFLRIYDCGSKTWILNL